MTPPPFSHPVKIDDIPKDGLTLRIEANAAERAALAALNGLPGIGAVSAALTITRAGKGGLRVRGAIHARATQTCVVSLEPFDVEINEPVDLRFAPPLDAKPREDARRARIPTPPHDIDDADAPDPIIDGKIDLGALAAEFFGLALDPYPRKPGIIFEPPA